ncbi:hypothetical protein ACFYOG_37170 [Streptomyces sp. NPDC007818]|uniref:hypothetical protein n=1 Tax=Streptomyces sp. NPDC007818 TaxID=3364780 RepID=UPI0036BA651B
MTTSPRRFPGAGPVKPIRAAEADQVRELPGIGFPGLEGLRRRAALGRPPAARAPQPRRALGIRSSESEQTQ